jgi:DNA-binding transcriptional MerR regulator
MERPQQDEVDIQELSDRARVSPRTIRYYIQQGLLPAPDTRGPNARYTAEHVDRLKLIRRLQHEHLPLSEIRKRLEGLDAKEIHRIVATDSVREPDTAADYVRSVLREGAASYASPMRAMSDPHATLLREQNANPNKLKRSQWERFTLAPDVELHVRRPVSREDNRKLDRLLEAAREIFMEELP